MLQFSPKLLKPRVLLKICSEIQAPIILPPAAMIAIRSWKRPMRSIRRIQHRFRMSPPLNSLTVLRFRLIAESKKALSAPITSSGRLCSSIDYNSIHRVRSINDALTESLIVYQLQSHAGLFNLCIVVLVAVNSRLIIENLMKVCLFYLTLIFVLGDLNFPLVLVCIHLVLTAHFCLSKFLSLFVFAVWLVD